jgi:hypothetical protein
MRKNTESRIKTGMKLTISARCQASDPCTRNSRLKALKWMRRNHKKNIYGRTWAFGSVMRRRPLSNSLFHCLISIANTAATRFNARLMRRSELTAISLSEGRKGAVAKFPMAELLYWTERWMMAALVISVGSSWRSFVVSTRKVATMAASRDA